MKNLWIKILIFIVGLVIGMAITYHIPSPIISLESEKEKVDSLQQKIDSAYEVKEVIKWRIDSVIKEKEIRVDSIKNLPISEAVEYLNERLKEYENIN